MTYAILTSLLAANIYHALDGNHINTFTAGFLVAAIIASLMVDCTK